MRRLAKGGALVAEMIRRPDHAMRWILNRITKETPMARAVPWLSWKCIEFLEGHVRPGMKIFEYGGGGSTLFFVKRGCLVTTVETSKDWLELISKEVTKTPNAAKNLTLRFAEKSSSPFVKQAYPKLVHDGGPWNIVLVDGWEELRPACAREARSAITTDGLVLIDNTDFPNIAPAVDEMSGMRHVRFRGLGTGRVSLGQTDAFWAS